MPEAETIVIGGGIAGASTAYYLAQQGHLVTLLERGEIASEASGVNAGGLGGLGWGNLPDLQAYLTMGSLELFKTIQIDLGYDIEFRQSGSLRAIQSEDQYDYLQDNVLRLRSQGYTPELLTAREAQAIEPEANPELPGFVYLSTRGQADPVKATQAFAAAARQWGAQILDGHEVTALQQTGDGGWQLETPQGVYQAESLVLAAGAWCRPLGALLGLDIPILAVRGQMWSTPSLPPRLFHVMGSAESEFQWHLTPGNDAHTPPDLTHREETRITRHLYGRQRKTGEIIFGGDRQLVGYDKTPNAAGIEVNRGQATEVIPALREIPVSRTWAGLMPFSLDGKPVIGKIPQLENLYIVSGMASSGFGRGPMAGKLLAEYVHSGHRPQVLAEADPARFVAISEGV